ncbi:MAG TPA: hypothetical protein VHZ51_14100 [Ktedonobacteraceae bacterium]|jgi:ATP/maltotriose-dependent transcriptional regulator MalT|nr:hypothetical protein [Ktedonobacteraceae bacterium]
MPVPWLALDPSDNDVIHFWTYVVAALRVHAPDLEAQASPLLQTQLALAIETLPMILINALSNVQREIIFVIDDYHLITEPTILASKCM